MDPIKQTFRESFADFQVTPGSDSWQRVQQKRQGSKRRITWLWPAGVAASLLLLAGLFWPPQPGQQPPTLTGTGISERPSAVQQPATPPLPEYETQHAPATPATAPANPAVQVIAATPVPDPVQSTGIVPDENPLPTTKAAEFAAAIAELPALEIRRPGVSRNTTPPGLVFVTPPPDKEIPNTRSLRLAELVPLLTDTDKTGPQKLRAALEQLRPRVLDDLIALATRPTEIEIIW